MSLWTNTIKVWLKYRYFKYGYGLSLLYCFSFCMCLLLSDSYLLVHFVLKLNLSQLTRKEVRCDGKIPIFPSYLSKHHHISLHCLPSIHKILGELKFLLLNSINIGSRVGFRLFEALNRAPGRKEYMLCNRSCFFLNLCNFAIILWQMNIDESLWR